uniref:F-actin monooxygenase n=1 Tax=Wuchereria bancrofti TaxID=6293 RepID=A0A1I8EK84_WUCBA
MDADRLFDAFAAATSFTKIQQLFAQLCALLDIDPYDNFNVFRRLKTVLNDWRAQKLWSLLEKRAEQKEYCHQKACECLSVLVIGAGPCGLRSAIECALLGAYVVLVEQRDCFSRNNVLHLWPFVIQDLKNLGIKIFYPKFCRGSIDHISIRQLQIFLVKIALVLGVQIHDSITFQRLIFPKCNENGIVEGWRAEFYPSRHILSDFVFDALIGADGKRNTVPGLGFIKLLFVHFYHNILEPTSVNGLMDQNEVQFLGFPKRELRGKLAIGITANFVNQRTLAEEKVQEISGVAYIFNQQFFKDMKEATGIDLENIVYYKDETHYFVMCAKKQSLLERGVIVEDNEDVSLLLSPNNINQEKLCDYAAEAADFATGGNLPNLKYARNHNDSEDVAMFDFTSLFSAQCSVRLIERCDRRLLMSIVGDSLHEPFWPTGSGCARGFLGVFDAVWMLRAYGLNVQGLMVLLAERESVYRLLAQAKPDNLHKQTHKYSIDPRTRYISLEMAVQPHEISHLIDTDNPRNVETNKALPLRITKAADRVSGTYIKSWNDGRALAALLGKFRPDLVDYLSLCAADNPNTVIEKIFSAVKKEYDIEPPCKNHAEWVNVSTDARVIYISSIVEAFKSDSQRMRETLMNAIRTSTISHKRKTRQVDTSRTKKTEPICRRASDLLNAFASTAVLNESVEETMKSFIKRKQDVDIGEVRDAVTELNGDEKFGYSCKRLDRNALIQSAGSQPVKYITGRPAVEKLNPERLYAVQRIVSGELEKEKTEEMYRNKQRLANVLTRKMDKHDIDEMKLKLEQTAMGLLFNKEQYRVLTSKEEKIICTNAAAARRTVNEGFKHADEKYKDIDEKLLKAETLLKNQNLVGIDIVSRTKNKNGVIVNNGSKPVNANKSPPPLPPKKTVLQESRISSSASGPENQSVIFRNKSSSSNNSSRPCSVPVMRLTCDSVNARQQIICQLCLKVVYLAERMQVEGMFIHKKCFRCAFCEQPLRLGNCAQDRNLRSFNPRFFCMQHINLPVLEKITRIEKNGCKAGGTYLPLLNDTLNTVSGYTTSCINQSAVSVTVQRTGRNSPSMLLGKTMEKMRAQKEAVHGLLSSHQHVMRERAEFEIYDQKALKLLKTFKERRQQRFQEQHTNILSSEQECEKSNGNFDATIIKNRSEMTAVTTVGSTKSVTAQVLAPFMGINEQASTQAKTKTNEQLELCRTSKRHSIPKQSSRVMSRFPRHLSLDLSRKDIEVLIWIGGFIQRLQWIEHLILLIFHHQVMIILRKQLQFNHNQLYSQDSNLHGTDLKNQKHGTLGKFSSFRTLRMRKGSYRIWIYMEGSSCNKFRRKGAFSMFKHASLSYSQYLIRKEAFNFSPTYENKLSPTLFTKKDIRRIQKLAEKILKQKEQERISAAQDLQRELEEIDVRKLEVEAVAGDLERRLSDDAENLWILEQWLLYVQEMVQLKQREEELKLRVSEFEVNEEYKDLQLQLKEVQNSGASIAEKSILKKTLAVLEMRDAIQKQLKVIKERAGQRKVTEASTLIELKGASYRNFRPVFI